PAAHLVRFARQQRRERYLLRPDRGHLLAYDRRDPVEHELAQWQPCVPTRRDAADVPGAYQQTVARHLGVRRILAERADEQVRHAQQHGGRVRAGRPAREAVTKREAVTRTRRSNDDGTGGRGRCRGAASLPWATASPRAWTIRIRMVRGTADGPTWSRNGW